MSTKLTKAALLAELEATRVALQQAQAENKSLRSQLAAPRASTPESRLAAMRAAKELAMRTGRVVKVH